ncbi:hypothetical protein ACIQM3_23345 [Streptomyces sp. NPDC091271]|uniref:hypothetical protein n=1 Tax=Streptomyces sp. NPDC091271 TaxID=3365980 RepID=UPI00381631F3
MFGGLLLIGRRKRKSPEELRGLDVETLFVLAEDSRAHDAGRVAEAGRLPPPARTVTAGGATHHSMPLGASGTAGISRHIEVFLSAPSRPVPPRPSAPPRPNRPAR